MYFKVYPSPHLEEWS